MTFANGDMWWILAVVALGVVAISRLARVRKPPKPDGRPPETIEHKALPLAPEAHEGKPQLVDDKTAPRDTGKEITAAEFLKRMAALAESTRPFDPDWLLLGRKRKPQWPRRPPDMPATATPRPQPIKGGGEAEAPIPPGPSD